MTDYVERAWVGWPAPIAAFKAAVESAIVTADANLGAGFAMRPAMTEPPGTGVAKGDILLGFWASLPVGFALPELPTGVFESSEVMAPKVADVVPLTVPPPPGEP